MASARSAVYVGEPHSSPVTAKRVAGAGRFAGRGEDLRREVRLPGPEQPGGPDDRELPAGGVRVGVLRGALSAELRGAIRVRRRRLVGRAVADPVPALPVEDLVRRDQDQVDAALRARAREDPGGVPVPGVGHRGVPGTAIDVGPGRRVDDDLDAVAVEPLPDRVRSIQVELGAAPGEGPARTRVRRLAERRDEGSPEPARGTRDGDAHPQSEPAAATLSRSRCPYWRS